MTATHPQALASPQPEAEAQKAVAWQPEMRKLIAKLRNGDWSLRSPDELACMIADMLERAIPRIATPSAGAPLPVQRQCIAADPLCPCADGDTCHYEGNNPFSLPVQRQEAAQVEAEYVPVLEYSAEDIVATQSEWFLKGHEAATQAMKVPLTPEQEVLPVVGWVGKDTPSRLQKQQSDTIWGLEIWPGDIALTPHAPAQATIVAQAAEIERLKGVMQERALQALSDDGQWMDETGRLRAELNALRADNERLTRERDEAREHLARSGEPFTVAIRRLTFVRHPKGRFSAELETDRDIPNDRIARVFMLALGARQGKIEPCDPTHLTKE